jgi:Tol biopolymer transport system component
VAAIDVATNAPTAAPATLVAAVATPEPATATPAAAAPQVNRIAIVNDQGQIETMSPTGNDRRVLTLRSDDLAFQFPAWAPDGRRLAVIGSRNVGGAIYVLDDAARVGSLANSQLYFSAREQPIYLFWSPDSSNLGFLANHTGDLLGLNVVAGDGTGESRLLATGAPFYWDWSADGHQLLIHSGPNRANNTLALIDLDGETQADNLAVPGFFQAPGIGRDGRYWAFAEEVGDGLSALVVVDTQTGVRQAHQEAGSLAFSWSPAQDLLAYTGGDVNSHPFWGPLRLLDVAGGETRLLSGQTVLAFFWSPDGRSIAFVTLNGRPEDEGINASARSRHLGRLAASPAQQGDEGFLTLSVIDVASGSGLRLLDFRPSLAWLAQFLPYFDQYSLSHRIWSPDSSALVLPVHEEGEDVILVVPIGGGAPFRLAEGDMAFWSHN